MRVAQNQQMIIGEGDIANIRFDLKSRDDIPKILRGLQSSTPILPCARQSSNCSVPKFHAWMLLQRQLVTDGTATAKALNYSLKRWTALTQFLDNGQLPIDNNSIENQIRPIAIGRNNWLFAGSLRAGQRAAAVMSLIQSAKLNGHDPYAYIKDVLTRLPTQKNS